MAEPSYEEREVSGWATGGLVFAATMLLIIGTFQAIAGLAAILEDEFFVADPNYVSTSTSPCGAGST